MGKQNRQRRAAKQKQRRKSSAEREHREPTSGPDRAQLLDALVFTLSSACKFPAPWKAEEVLQQCRGFERELEIAADLVVHEAIRAAWEHGWSPTDLHEIARRRSDAATTRYLDEAVVVESRRYAQATVHPRWRAQLAGVSASVEPVPDGPQLRRWVGTVTDVRSALTYVLKVLDLLARLPSIQILMPLPGSHHERPAPVAEVDEKMLARVRGLLAKAEATEFPDEAEALSAKAQALMVRHSLLEAVADHDRGQASHASARRMWIDNPYVAAKVVLVQAVAQANRCRAVWMKHLGCVVAVGSETDLDLVDLLTTSLLVQANRAMLVAGRHHAIQGQARTKSFRLSFLVAYASRIGERLNDASSAVTAELERDHRLLPVLAARNRAADEAFTRLFPETVASTLQAYDQVGLGAGRAAADTAMLDVRDSIAG